MQKVFHLCGSLHASSLLIFSENVLSQKEHAKGFSPVWALSCVIMYDFCVNALPQKEHEKGFSPVWVPSCLFTFDFSENF